MNINPNCKLEKIPSETTYNQSLKHIKSFGRHLVASDGHVIAVVKVEREDDDVPGCFSTGLYAAARKNKKINHINITAEKTSTQTKTGTLEEDTIPATEYPTIRPFFKKAKKAAKTQTLTVGINSKLLYNLAEALGSEDGAVYLHFTADGFSTDQNDYRKQSTVTLAGDLQRHETKDNIGIIMPIKKG